MLQMKGHSRGNRGQEALAGGLHFMSTPNMLGGGGEEVEVMSGGWVVVQDVWGGGGGWSVGSGGLWTQGGGSFGSGECVGSLWEVGGRGQVGGPGVKLGLSSGAVTISVKIRLVTNACAVKVTNGAWSPRSRKDIGETKVKRSRVRLP